MSPIELRNRSDFEGFVRQYDYFLFDCDGMSALFGNLYSNVGVIWRGNEILKNASKTIAMLRNLGKR